MACCACRASVRATSSPGNWRRYFRCSAACSRPAGTGAGMRHGMLAGVLGAAGVVALCEAGRAAAAGRLLAGSKLARSLPLTAPPMMGPWGARCRARALGGWLGGTLFPLCARHMRKRLHVGLDWKERETNPLPSEGRGFIATRRGTSSGARRHRLPTATRAGRPRRGPAAAPRPGPPTSPPPDSRTRRPNRALPRPRA